ncbi:MAG TPA: cytochrome c-type biogenesis CcmF C-terminal domain-containing protein, partial [Burkholderiales bacterium]|nr:cytochrome c-type biogenesis CcmF C-terminal domain-containing protein [Burkholderiales bacterium]
TRAQIFKSLVPPLITGAVFVVIGTIAGARNVWTILTLMFGGYAAHVTLVEMWTPVAQGGTRALRRGRRRFGSYIVHGGAVIVLVAIAVSSTMKTSHEVRLTKGESATIGPYTLTFLSVADKMEPNRQSTIARFAVTSNGKPVTTLEPRMNQYPTMREPIGTPAVYSTLVRDLYLSIMNVDEGTQTISVMMLITPMVSWIWIAVIIMGLGGVVALVPARSPALRESKESVPVPGEAARA